jgi:hypothetical protein
MSVSGTAVDSQGRPLAGRQMNLGQEWRGPGFGMMFQNGSGVTVPGDTTGTTTVEGQVASGGGTSGGKAIAKPTVLTAQSQVQVVVK